MGRPISFTVDARLLQELGERLVGRPHIALGELIKNSYDADATVVEITFDGDSITITDNGHGMDEETFVSRWMRIGTTEKAREQVSPKLGRPLTGSKGVGRLAAQLLAGGLRLVSAGLRDSSSTGLSANAAPTIQASIRWADAVQESELTNVTVDFDEAPAGQRFANGSTHGTTIELTELLADWGPQEFQDLAQEIWALRPPAQWGGDRGFDINLKTSSPEVQELFEKQMSALFEIASATISGRLLPLGDSGPANAERIILDPVESIEDEDGIIVDLEARVTAPQLDASRFVELTLDLVGYPRRNYVAEIPDCQLENFDFTVQVFDLVRRQPKKIRVAEAREYLARFGGVHLYDNGFRLPYYGPDNDWLRLELDHARRLSRSRLMPKELQIPNAMQDLPSNKRVYGAVNISTSSEQLAARTGKRDASKALAIQISRDRLAGNQAFNQVARAVRLGIDLYAAARAQSKVRRVLERSRPARRDVTEVMQQAVDVVESLREELPASSFSVLQETINVVGTEMSYRDTAARAYASLLGSLATAGMTSLAYEHEVAAQRGQIDEVARTLRVIASRSDVDIASELEVLSATLRDWGTRSERIRALFRPLLEEENRTEIGRYQAKGLIEDVADTLRVLARRTTVTSKDVDTNLILPAGTYTAWSAIVQNILVNAFRATLESKPGIVRVDGHGDQYSGYLRFQDNGSGGVELKTSDRLFLPFERRGEVSERATALGLGGSGLGLTIVKMITDELGCNVSFEQPDEGWATSIRIRWGRL